MPYIGAPYNFVPFPTNVFAPNTVDELKVHDRIDKDLFSGEIKYSITAETPIIVGDGDKKSEHFFKNEYEQYAIPGSTIRGLLRSNVQILSCSSFEDDIDDYELMYRNVASGLLKSSYNTTLGSKSVSFEGKNISVLLNVKAGYITKKEDKYYIYPTEVKQINGSLGKLNYYILNERIMGKKIQNYPYYKKHPEVFQHDLNKPFKKIEKNNRVGYKGTENPLFKPGYYEVSYELSGTRTITRIDEPGILSKEGVMLITGPMRDKKAVYIIPKISITEEAIQISKSDIKSFEVDFNNRFNVLVPLFRKNMEKDEAEATAKAFFGLPKSGEFKPVFYIELDGRLYFGYTPRLRLFFKHSIKKGYRNGQIESNRYDVASSIFGISDADTGAFKSKVACLDAIADGCPKEDKSYSLILASPKPTSYLDYLLQENGNISTYNDEDFQLRGVKQYWMHKNVNSGTKTDNASVGTSFTPLAKGTVFKGILRFQNLTENELGVLLWALKLNPESRQNIGKAKPYGFGRVRISDIDLQLLDTEKAYSLDAISWSPYEQADEDKFINTYKNTVINGKKVADLPHINKFFMFKDCSMMPDEEVIKYMSIDAGDYRNRMTPLQSVEELVNGQSEVGGHQPNAGNQRTVATQYRKNQEIEVELTKVSIDKNDKNQQFGSCENGKVFQLPLDVAKGDRVRVKITKVDGERFFATFVR